MNSSMALCRAATDNLPLSVAVLNAEGDILSTNAEWQEFGRENDIEMAPECIGANYLDTCDRSGDDEYARRAGAGIREVLAGEQEQFTLEYPCHSPDPPRWFLLNAAPVTDDSEMYAVVTHLNITDRKLTELAVSKQNDDLVAISRLISHDLRNPLTIALGWLDMWESPEADQVENALKRMEEIISDGLMLVQMEPSDDNKETVDLGEIASTSWEYVDSLDATLTVDDKLTVVAHASLLQNIFENLFRNAVNHGGSDVTICVGKTQRGFYIEDDGSGIPEEKRDTVFEVGYTNSTGGNGFGLAIVKRLVLLHGWNIQVTEADTGGARFEIDTSVGAVEHAYPELKHSHV
ncbi:PAS domain-containing sensor histidine kinase [Natronorubrum halophilum]|uniref:PAS domain-containing sensor histidine kinase n=1 Tax=Natronorubrum halophilum TaxID=1702106 RepID=UPI000EF6929E|nr:PAS domain-containing sensor histidine kinase [Natronorubrum halophilum]